MKSIIISTSLITATCVFLSNGSFSQHTQKVHENLVDDFFTPYPISLAKRQKFTGTIGEPGGSAEQSESGDWWDYYVFQSPSYGKVEVVLRGFNKPVNLTLEQRSHNEPGKKEVIAESLNRFTTSHRISARVSPHTPYYIAVGTGVIGDGHTPYEMTVKYKRGKKESIQPAERGEYAPSLSGESCHVPDLNFSSLELPAYVVADSGSLAALVRQDSDTDSRIHEILQFDPAQGMLVHEFSDELFDEETSLSLRRDVMLLGTFEAGEFHGEVWEHEVVTDPSGTVVHETGDCSRRVTAASH